MEDMYEKKRINKLTIPLTIKSASILSVFTIMATSIGGCAPKKDKKDDEINTSVITSSNVDEELANNSDAITSSQTDESITEEKKTENNTTTNNNKQNDITTNKSNNTTTNKTNGTTRNNQNNNNTTNSNTNNSNQNSNNNNVNDKDNFIPLTPNNINNIPTFERAVMEVSRKTRGGFGGIWDYHYKNQKYTSYGIPTDEFTYILSYLNKNYLSDETLNKLLGKYSCEELKQFTHILETLINFVDDAKTTNDWNGLIIDNKIKNQFTNIEKAYIEYKFNNNSEEMKKILLANDCSNPFVGYYLGFASCLLT